MFTVDCIRKGWIKSDWQVYYRGQKFQKLYGLSRADAGRILLSLKKAHELGARNHGYKHKSARK